MKTNEEIAQDWNRLYNEDIENVCTILRGYEKHIQEYIADFVAALCDVDLYDMMTSTSSLGVLHARWLFWYAYRYMSNEPYARISEITARYGKRFSEQSISNCVNKMGDMIASETMWSKRWIVIKHVIKLSEGTEKQFENEAVVTVRYPKNVRIELKPE